MGNKLRGNAIDGRDGWSWVRSWRPSTERALEAGNAAAWQRAALKNNAWGPQALRAVKLVRLIR